jgi:L-ascorbate metabolism protein UlaG (beta-lactamase superfamily)
MKITWFGHSCFKIEKNNFAVVTDPYEAGSVPGLAPVCESADLVLCSHEHGDHNARSSVKLTGAEANPFTITRIETYHDDVKGAKRGCNTIHILDDGEQKLAHLGDLGCELERNQLELLKNLDVVMIPVGGYYTIDAQQAADLVAILKPRIVIPMHYRSVEDGYGYDVISQVSDFTKTQERVMTISESTIDTNHDFPAQVIVMQPVNCCKK